VAADKHSQAGEDFVRTKRRSESRASNEDSSEGKARKGEPKKEYDRLLSKGIRLLSMREHSVQEMITKLSVKCDSLDTLHVVIERLLESKYLSDERFTESYVRSRTNRGFGPTKIKSELSQKGIKNNMIDDYLDVSSSIWHENAQNQYRKKYGDGSVSDYNTWAKRARFLQSRGFTMEQIQVTVPSVDYD
jgi:regulatory protein